MKRAIFLLSLFIACLFVNSDRGTRTFPACPKTCQEEAAPITIHTLKNAPRIPALFDQREARSALFSSKKSSMAPDNLYGSRVNWLELPKNPMPAKGSSGEAWPLGAIWFFEPTNQPDGEGNEGSSAPINATWYKGSARAAGMLDEKEEECNLPREKGLDFPWPKRITLRDIERGGIGYKSGYSSLDILFAPCYEPGHFLPMIDVRGHHLHNEHNFDSYAVNVGLAGRYVSEKHCRIFGLNAYYDYRRAEMGGYNQVGIGMEILSCQWDFRLNGYLPLGKTVHSHNCLFDDFDGGFFAEFQDSIFALSAVNAEIGYHVSNYGCFSLYAAAGPYYLTGRHDQKSWGGRARLRPQYRDYLAVELSASVDSIFGAIFQGEIILSWPLYELCNCGTKRCCCTCLPESVIYQPVQRFEIIPLKEHTHWESNFCDGGCSSCR